MTITINGTTGIAGVDGSASVPAIKGNDADTGIYYPTANTVAAAAGGTAVWNASSTFGFKNRFINGGMGIWQRGTSGFTTIGNYSADRWLISGGTSLSAVSRSTDVPAGFQFSISVAGTNVPQAVQRIESLNCFDLVGQSVTISFWAKQTSGAGSDSLFLQLLHPNSTDNYAAVTQIGGNVFFTGTSGWVQYIVTFNNLPAGAANGLQVIIGGNTVGSATFLITGAQIEAGPVATSFDFRSYGTELALCQRYYEKSYDGNIPPGTATSAGRVDMPTNTSAASAYYMPTTVQFKVTKRTQPSIRFWDQAGNLSRVTDYSGGGLVRTDNRNSVWGVASGDTSFYLINTQNAASFSSFQWDAPAEL